ncbi:MAG: serine/threonine protein kinase [Deltaproteobacteria bacterium]|nr:MAG: serine/threonine protein kinase [Deltaproteobacteria bacterium]
MDLGRYRLDEQVGQGGMAVVWRGWDTQLRRTVAVKVLHAHLHAREEIRRRFDREAHAVARLHHPHILDVYDFSGPQAQPSYLVTEFIRGQTLRAFAEAHPFDPPELAAACLLPIAEALEHAHKAGVVHRDLKPENVMVRDDGVVKLTDFGIAALLDPDEKFTMTGSILGSPAHLAPETIEGKPADPRADLFSFGTIFYWLSSGQLPYQAASPAALLRNILEGKRKDPRLIRPSLSDAQARIIARCLENDPAKRYQNAGEVKTELSALLREAGLDDPLRELAAFVKNPEQHAGKVRERLVARSLLLGEEQLAQGKTSAALSAFGRALALEPGNARAQGQVERIRRRERLIKYGRRALLAFAVVAVAWLAAWEVRAAIDRARAIHEKEILQAALHPHKPLPASAETAAAKPEALPRRKPQPPAPAKIAKLETLPVKLHARFSGQVTVDGRELGSGILFPLDLTAGPHTVIVRHQCCAELQQQVTISRSRPDQMYPLKYGPPLPARLKILNAPAGARVLVNDIFVGTVPSPPPLAMTQPDEKATVTIGDRTLTTTLKAGIDNDLDYAKASP